MELIIKISKAEIEELIREKLRGQDIAIGSKDLLPVYESEGRHDERSDVFVGYEVRRTV